MKQSIASLCIGLLAALPWQPLMAQPAGGSGGQRMAGGGINYAPQAAVYSVTFVDPSTRTLRLRAADGRTGAVHVAENVYDLSKVKAGDKLRITFVVPDAADSKLKAAGIWPEP